jgi:hypothetical protein
MLHRVIASTPRRRIIPSAVAVCLSVGALLSLATSAQAAHNLVTGFADHIYRAGSPDQQAQALQMTRAEDAGIIRINVVWADIAHSGRPSDPANPADPAYDFAQLDGDVTAAEAAGLDVMFTVYKAPPWAEGPDRPPVNFDTPEGTWRPDPGDYANFATALASRYSGNFVPAGATTALPHVKYYEVWNEENLWAYLSPQYEGKKKEVAVELYRDLLNHFYDAIKRVDGKNKVILGGMAPFGDAPGGVRTRPLIFLRALFCLTDKLDPVSCPQPAKFDILGIHPINTLGAPTQSATDPDDITSADVPAIVKILRAAQSSDTLATGGSHPIWVTEFWWESYPDGGVKAKPGLAKHGRWIEQALYLFWKSGARVAINLQLIDDVFNSEDDGSLQTGVFLSDGTPKPAATSFRFPFVLDRQSKNKVFVWGKSPEKGKLTIEKKQGGGWHDVKRVKVKDNKVFTTKLDARGKGKYRATVGDQTSLVWTLRK